MVFAYRAQPDFGTARDIADRIAIGHSYPVESVNRWADTVAPLVGSTCDRSFLVHALFIQLRSSELAVARSALGDIDRRRDAAEATADRLVHCAPTESFGWLAKVWAARSRSGSDPQQIRWLAEAYRTGPYESWIEARRNPLAMTSLDRVPIGVANAATEEFFRIVGRHQFELAFETFRRLDDETRRTIVERLRGGRYEAHGYFARRIAAEGIAVDLPNVYGKPDRPWLR